MTTPKTIATATTPANLAPLYAESPEVKALREEMAKLMAQNKALAEKAEALEKAKKHGLSYKVSEKGALSVYGMGRFPVTLYAEQWATLFDNAEGIKAFIEANKSKLSTKADKVAAEEAKSDAERKARVAEYEAKLAAEKAAKVG